MTAFLTGSQVYGRPTSRSDIDLCILVNEDTKQLLYRLSNRDRELQEVSPEYISGSTLRFDDLNLCVFTDQSQFEAWRRGTRQCIRMAPVSRETAVAIIQEELRR